MGIRIGCTGHRTGNFEIAKKRLNDLFRNNIISLGVSGGADGWDSIFSNCCIYYKVPLHLYIPYKKKNISNDLKKALSWAESVSYTSETWYKGCEFDRDLSIVENSDILIACYDGRSSGGTLHTINLAKQHNKLWFNFG